jgi:hypothetical protein
MSVKKLANPKAKTFRRELVPTSVLLVFAFVLAPHSKLIAFPQHSGVSPVFYYALPQALL